MKRMTSILALCIVGSLMSSLAFTKSNHPSIEDDRDFSFEFQDGSTEDASERTIANTIESDGQDKKIKEDSFNQLPNQKEKKQNTDKERDIASDEEVFDQINDRGIRYWKY